MDVLKHPTGSAGHQDVFFAGDRISRTPARNFCCKMARAKKKAIFSRLELAELVEEDGDSRKLLAEPGELMEPKRFCWSGPAAALSALFLVAVAGVAWYVALPSHSEVSPAMMQMKVAKHACMAQCPKPRRLKEKEEPDPAIALENCMEKCPSSGFMAAVEFEGCKAACESKHPQSGKMAKMPAGGPPMEACKQKCADGISGNFWRVRLQRCANQCAITTAAQEVMDQMKYNISSPELRDLETEVVSVLKKRITFKKRPDDHPFSFLIYQCKSKTEDALAKALGIPDGHAKPSVIMRPFSPGTRPVVSKVLAVDPGNDLEAAVDVEALSGETLDKLALPETLKSFDQALQDAVSEDPIMKDLLNLHPALAMEYSSASLAGDYVSMGWHTVCRRDKADTTLDGYGTSQIVNDQTLNSCSAMCNNWKSYCYGFEFRTREKRCEIWTAPICYHAEAPADISGSSFVDFRCFKRCQ